MSEFIYNKWLLTRFVALASLLFMVPFLSAQESATPLENQPNKILVKKSTSANSIKFAVDEEFSLSGDFYLGDKSGAGVLLLHDCSHSSKSYSVLGELLAEQGINALAIDFRGYGESTSNLFSHKALKQKVKNIENYQAEVAMLTSYWENDVLHAYNYLRSKIGNEQPISIVSSGCAVNEAVKLADKMRVNSFVILSPIMDYMEKERYKNLIDIPSYFVSSAHHSDSFLTAQELFSWNGDSRSTTQVFKGVNQGHSLLRRNKFLTQNLAIWLRGTMN